jgi:hypothetical protein
VGPALLVLAAGVVPLVTHGLPDTAHPGVVAIVDPAGLAFCSGTLIDPHFVLTAAHCVGPSFPQGSRAVIGEAATSPAASAPIATFRVHPAFDPGTLTDDAALLVLSAPLPVTPVPLGSAAPAVGSEVTVVGWGETTGDAGDFGTKRVGTARVTVLDALTFQVAPDPSQPCAGDSGGPALLASGASGAIEAVVGITSQGDIACSMGAKYTRVDAVTADFISPTLAALGQGTASAGERCLYPEQCAAGADACVTAPDAPALTYCTAGCSVNADCPPGMICASDGNGSQCRYPVPTPGAFGGGCDVDSDCVVGTCLGGSCTFRCAPTGGDPCPYGAACEEQGNGIDFFCAALTPSASGSACAVTASPRDDVAAWGACVAGALLVAAGGRRRRQRRLP